MLSNQELVLIIYFVAISLLLLGFVIIFFVAFQRRKTKLLLEKFEAEKRYEQELVNSRLEIQEQTLKGVGQELHDNIGQLLSVVNMQLSIVEEASQGIEKSNLENIREIVRSTIQEVRALSKSLNNEAIDHFGLEESLQNEINRLNRLSNTNFVFQKKGNSVPIDSKDSIIIFRILQECINNVIKHAEAENLKIKFVFKSKKLIIKIIDDGKGFAMEELHKSSGFLNMSERASLLKAKLKINSKVGKGTFLKLIYPYKY